MKKTRISTPQASWEQPKAKSPSLWKNRRCSEARPQEDWNQDSMENPRLPQDFSIRIRTSSPLWSIIYGLSSPLWRRVEVARSFSASLNPLSQPLFGICKLPALDLWRPADSFCLAGVEASRLEFKGPRVGHELGSHPNLCQARLPSPRPLPLFA